MTPQRRIEIEQAAKIYGSGDGSTGTILAEIIRELLAEIDFQNLHIAASVLHTFSIGSAGGVVKQNLTLQELLTECERITDDDLRFVNIYLNDIYQDFFYFKRDDSPQFQSCIDTEAMPLSKHMADICNLKYFRKLCEVNNDRS